MSTQPSSPNILLVIADDLGRDVFKVSGSGPTRKAQVVTNDGAVDIVGELPNISYLLRNGLYFGQAWAQPACSPTRGSIYTGTHPWKNGVGSPIGPQLPAASVTSLPELLPSGYASGLFGKWHLGNTPGNRPDDHGWDRHVGTLAGVVADYRAWDKDDSATGYGGSVPTSKYATKDTIDEAADWVNSLGPTTPWFLTIAFHTPHDPFHRPPKGFTAPATGTPNTNEYQFNLMTQNMDSNIGRLLGAIAMSSRSPIPRDQLENTVIIFIGDNGSHRSVALEEEKTEIFEGGLRIPMIIADGQAFVGEALDGVSDPAPFYLTPEKLNRRSPRLVHVVDLYRTIAEIADPATTGFPTDMDSVSLIDFFTQPGPQPRVRAYNFSQWFSNGSRRATIRNRQYKLNYDDALGAYQLFAYQSGQIPGIEGPAAEQTANDLFDDALNSTDADAEAALNELLDELLANYQLNPVDPFPDPR